MRITRYAAGLAAVAVVLTGCASEAGNQATTEETDAFLTAFDALPARAPHPEELARV